MNKTDILFPLRKQYNSHCWRCKSPISSLYCEQCSHCNWYVCTVCGSCYLGQCTFATCGFDENGLHRNGTKFSDKGFDVRGFDIEGFDQYGYNQYGYDRTGYDKHGYNRSGYDHDGFDKYGYDCDGYDRSGFDYDGYDREGYNSRGYDRNLLNRDGYNPAGFDKDGYDKNGYNKDGFDRNGVNRQGIDKKGLDAEWRSLIKRRVAYISAGNNIKKGTIIDCYIRAQTYYVDVQFDDGVIYRKIDFNHTRSIGILKFLIKKSKGYTYKQFETPPHMGRLLCLFSLLQHLVGETAHWKVLAASYVAH